MDRRAPEIEGVDVAGAGGPDVFDAVIPNVADVTVGAVLVDATDSDVVDADATSGNVASADVCLPARDFCILVGSGLGSDDVAGIAAAADAAGMVEEAIAPPPRWLA